MNHWINERILRLRTAVVKVLGGRVAMLFVTLGLALVQTVNAQSTGAVGPPTHPLKDRKEYRDALIEVTMSERDDPSVKAAVAVLQQLNLAPQSNLAVAVDADELEEAQLNLEDALLARAKIRKPGFKELAEIRQKEIAEKRLMVRGRRKKR